MIDLCTFNHPSKNLSPRIPSWLPSNPLRFKQLACSPHFEHPLFFLPFFVSSFSCHPSSPSFLLLALSFAVRAVLIIACCCCAAAARPSVERPEWCGAVCAWAKGCPPSCRRRGVSLSRVNEIWVGRVISGKSIVGCVLTDFDAWDFLV